MSKSYKERLKLHRKSLFKKLLSVSCLPLFIIVLATTFFLLRESPEHWKSDTIVINDISSTTIASGGRGSGSRIVAQIADDNGQYFVLSQMKPKEALSALKAGDEYTVVYASEFARLHIKGISQGGVEIVSTNDSAQSYEKNKTATIVLCSVCILILLILFAVTIKFFCKEETKQICHLKQKLKAALP
ncbi:MAG: hypothetical protein IJ039_06160 [Clostridia bacterium]|nr:hypothetical protein [Clostridia bacterium]